MTNDPIQLVMKLLAIPGASGQEGAVMAFIADQLRQAGCPLRAMRHDQAHRRSPRGGEVGNLIVHLPGTVPGPCLLLSAHTDTVPICVGTRPVRKGHLVKSAIPGKGLGADDRSGVAVLLHTACQLLRLRLPHPPISFLFTTQEEVGITGSRYLNVDLLRQPALAFNFDGSSANRVVIGAIGSHLLEVDIQGIAAHAAIRPRQGVSAISIASLALAELFEGGWLGRVEKGRRMGLVNPGTIQGGSANNVVAPSAKVTFGVRSHSVAFRKRLLEQIEKAFTRAAKRVRTDDGRHGQISVNVQLNYEAFELKRQSPVVRQAMQAVKEVTGQPAQVVVTDSGLDANWLNRHGIPTVTLGSGQFNNHNENEYLDLREYTTSCQIAWQLALGAKSHQPAASA